MVLPPCPGYTQARDPERRAVAGRGPPWGEGGCTRDPVALAIEAAERKESERLDGGGLKQSWQGELGWGGTSNPRKTLFSCINSVPPGREAL